MASNPRSTAKNTVNNDPVDALKRRSRRRLVGSIALFLAAIIIVPALVETESSQTPSNVELIVPERPSVDTMPQEVVAEEQTQAISKPVVVDKLPESTTAQGSKQSEPKPEVQKKPEQKPEAKKIEPKVEPKKNESKSKADDDLIARFAELDENAQYWVQVAAVSDKNRAYNLRTELAGKGFSSKVEVADQNGGSVYRVRVGPFSDHNKADGIRSQLANSGYQGRVVQ